MNNMKLWASNRHLLARNWRGFDPKATSSPYVTVEDYAKAYRDGSWTASQAMERFLYLLAKLHRGNLT